MKLTIVEVKKFLGILGDEQDDQIEMLLPAVIKIIEAETNSVIDILDVDEGLAFVISKFIEYFMQKAGVKSYSLSRESVTYSDDIPVFLTRLLKPYIVGTPKETGAIQFFPVRPRR